MTHHSIPAGWKEVKLGKVANFRNGKGHENSISENGKYIVVNSKFVSSNGEVKKYSHECFSPLSIGDIAMVMSDVPNGKAIAKCFLVLENEKYTLNQRICAIKSKEVLSPFLYRTLSRNRYFLSFDDGVKQTNLRKDEILACPIIFPPLPEQHRIVAVLETWDKAIEKLEQKIRIKKQIKKGLMQKLLTGKIRLFGFTEEWETVKLESFLKEISEKTTESNQYEIYSVTKNGIVPQNDYFDKQIASQDNSGYKIIKKKNLVFSTMNLWMGSLDFFNYEIGIVSPAYKIFSVKEEVALISFLKDFMKTLYMLNVYKNNSEQGASIVRRNLDLKGLLKYKVKIPSLPEQTAIARILTTADTEIETLETKLSLLQEQKKYLLNTLITGKIRTPENMQMQKNYT